jgi:hypothetical protein
VIAELREKCSQARRRFTRAQRRRWTRNEEEISRTYKNYKEARRLQREIKIEKNRSWKELIESVESHPWERPYKIVLSKLRPSATPLTENMDPETLNNVIGTLFPRQGDCPKEPEIFLSLSSSDSEEEGEAVTSE